MVSGGRTRSTKAGEAEEYATSGKEEKEDEPAE
jgi:hypothetical protein